MKKLLALTLLLILVLSFVAACASPADNRPDSENANEPAGDVPDGPGGEYDSPVEDIPAETETDEVTDDVTTALDTGKDVPDENAFATDDLGGYNFRILTYNTISNNMANCTNDFDEPSDQTYANAVYNRNLQVQELLNVTIFETVFESGYAAYDEVRTFHMAASHDYDICFMNMYYSICAAKWGLYADLENFDGIDLENSWWNKDCTEQLALNGKRMLVSGDISVSDKDSLWAVYFNKNLIDSLSLESPYELIASGNWTWDKLQEMSVAAFSSDASTAGLLTTSENIAAGWSSAGQKLVSLDESGKPLLSWGNDDFYAVFAEMASIMNSAPVLKLVETGTEGIVSVNVTDRFNEGNALFASNPLSMVGNMRSGDIAFGIVPSPKYDLSSENYISHVTNYSCVAGVPGTGYDFAYEIGIVTEALAAKGQEILTPAYYDILLTSASGRDEESAPMLELIFDSRSYDIGIFMNFKGIYRDLVSDENCDPDALYRKTRKAIEHEFAEEW